MKTYNKKDSIILENIYSHIYRFNEDKYNYAKWVRKDKPKESISIYFFKTLITKILFSKSLKSYYIEIPNDYSEFFTSDSYKPMSPVKSGVRFLIPDYDSLMYFKDSFSKLYLFLESNYCDDEFGCCHLYNECSDAKKCIHANIVFSNACYYKKNLKNGLIFYGKNRNV